MLKGISKALLSIIIVLIFALFITGLWIGGCSYSWSHIQNGYDEVKLGDTKEVVIKNMGSPSHIETSKILFSRYADQKCQGLCVQRWWYEQRMCLDLKAWSLEFDKSDKVIDKYPWVSP